MTGGGLSLSLSPAGRQWIFTKPRFFLSVSVLNRRFRTLMLAGLWRLFSQVKPQFRGDATPLAAERAFLRWLDSLRKIEWVVYTKPPFGGPQQVLEYFGRYTHRAAISNQRLQLFDGHTVTFQYKDHRWRAPRACRTLTLGGHEFIRCFLLHSLPPGFQRIRHYGLLASSRKRRTLPPGPDAARRYGASCPTHHRNHPDGAGRAPWLRFAVIRPARWEP